MLMDMDKDKDMVLAEGNNILVVDDGLMEVDVDSVDSPYLVDMDNMEDTPCLVVAVGVYCAFWMIWIFFDDVDIVWNLLGIYWRLSAGCSGYGDGCYLGIFAVDFVFFCGVR